MSVDDDAREFGQHFKQGGWRLGLLVARNVEPGKPGRPKEKSSPEMVSDADAEPEPCKVSMTVFADKAGVSQSHVSYYYNAWQLAAEDGLCQRAEQLSPGEEDGSLEAMGEDEDDEDRRQLWLTYYHKARGSDSEEEPVSAPKKTGTKQGPRSKSTKDSPPESRVEQDVEALVGASEQFSKKLDKVLTNTSIRLLGHEAGLTRFAEGLRQTKFVLDRDCQRVDRALNSIGYGDAEDVENDDQPEDNS